MNLSITGSLGSGKSSVCRELKAMGYEIISGGDIFRSIGAEKGVSVVELNEMAKLDRSIDDMIDNRTTRLGMEKDNVVFDSRIAWNFLKDSFNVFIYVDVNDAARRIFNDDQRKSETYASVEECRESVVLRQNLEMERFKDLYNIDYYDVNNYNLVIDSTNATPKEVAEAIIEYFKRYQQEKFDNVMLIGSRSLAAPSVSDKVTLAVRDGRICVEAGYEKVINAVENKETFVQCEMKKTENGGCMLNKN